MTLNIVIDPWEFRESLLTYGNDANRERFNNWRILDPKLWSNEPSVDSLVEVLSLCMWGRVLTRRADHLRVILMNLVRLSPDVYLGYHRNKSYYHRIPRRYNPAHITETIISVIDSLIEHGFVTNHPGRHNHAHGVGYVSKINITDELLGIMAVYGVDERQSSLHPHTELVELREARTTKYSNGKLNKPKGKPLDYDDTSITTSMRTFLETYNDHLRGTTLEYQGDIQPHCSVHRIFNGTWEQGGRFYGGVWQKISAEQRATILINNQPVVELDYSSLHPTLVYASAGIEPCGDIYDIPDVPRKIIKEAFMRALNNKARGHALNGLQRYITKHNEGVACSDTILKSLETTHSVIQDHFYRGIGLSLLKTDADICGAVLRTLTEVDIPCLSVHDSFIVPECHADYLREVMVSAFQCVTGASFNPMIKQAVTVPAL